MTKPQPDWRLHGVRVVHAGGPRHQHAADAGDEPRRRDQLRQGRGAEAVGRHGHHSSRRQDRRPPSRRAGERHLRGEGPGPHALGRAARICRRGRPRATSSSCRPMYRTRRSTPAPTSRSNACWCAATRKRWSSILTSSRSSGPRPCTGSTRRRSDRAWRCARRPQAPAASHCRLARAGPASSATAS